MKGGCETGEYYTAAVVEFAPNSTASTSPISRSAALDLMNENVDRFEDYTKTAVQKGAQIIVFPEYGFIGWPEEGDWTRDSIFPFLEMVPGVGSNPCEMNKREVGGDIQMTARLSCIAKDNAITLVVGYGDFVNCNPSDGNCRDDGRLQYNAAIAFSPDGSVIAKYWKHHLYADEDVWYDVPAHPHKSSFQTPFGVEFGVFICFDIFWELTVTLYDYAFPTYWDNTSFKSSTLTQRLWSWIHQVNFLAANIGTDKESSGSGIWNDGRALRIFYNPTFHPEEKLLVSKVPILKEC
eukprot:CAMPEP_0174261080 /NCGR_PEP_ID=MMETSP0439-20130205/11222_1 /TAXON_ID=0 /ORGANISM="Stereomyxa ramosa, Strain Chinc5" /LENGTH=293 /DNA_ID=CAMNT_0015345497 /DNA_START=119 /DNA_END=1000 /DNA_ORIENTATION=-